MAQVNVIRAYRAVGLSDVPLGDVAEAEELTSGATTVPSTMTAESDGEVWVVTSVGNAIYVKFGTGSVTANKVNSWLIPDGGTREFGVLVGQTCAVINA